jgi:hypothetical protein
MYFGGGNGDGLAFATGDSRSWGFLGGSGRNDSLFLTASQTLVTFSSADAQTFTVGDAATAMNTLTIRQDTAIGTGVTTANGLRVTIPADLDMVWDTSDTTAVIGGSASGKVSTTVAYADAGKTLVLTVTSNFADGDTVTVSGLSFKTFTSENERNLGLDITGSASWYETDVFEKIILVGPRSTGFLGGSGRSDALYDGIQTDRPWSFFGGNGRADVMKYTGSQTVMTFTSTGDQTFTSGDASTIASTVTITQEAAVGTGVASASDLRLVIPVAIGMSWDTTKNWAALTVTGSASAKVGGVSYPDNKTVVLDVTSNFADGESVTVAGLAFDNFIYAGIQPLLLDISGTGVFYEPDVYSKSVLMVSRTAGYLGGSGRGEAQGSIYLLPRNMVEMGTFF